jgi:hypothetical protein
VEELFCACVSCVLCRCRGDVWRELRKSLNGLINKVRHGGVCMCGALRLAVVLDAMERLKKKQKN